VQIKITAIAWMTISLDLRTLLADEEPVLFHVTRECNARDTWLDEQTCSQRSYTAVGAAIVNGLDKPIVEVRAVFHFLQERNEH
jgi:hypothetical protein